MQVRSTNAGRRVAVRRHEAHADAGWPLVRRWLYVARMASPHERADIAHAAACVVQEHTGYVAMYRETMALSGDDAGVDTAWCEATEARALAIRERLSAALARCQSHLLSDELRAAHMDMGEHLCWCGAFHDALAHYESAREHCTSNEKALAVYMAAAETAYAAASPSAVLAYADKAEAALQAIECGRDSSEALAAKAARTSTLGTLARWALADADAELPATPISAPLTAWTDLVPTATLAWCAVLNALRTPPPEQRTCAARLAKNAMFQQCTERDTAPRDVLAAYLASDIARCVHLLQEHAPRLAEDIVLGAERVPRMLQKLEARLLQNYLRAFSRVSLATLAVTLGSDATRAAAQVLELVAAGALDARIDWCAQTVALADGSRGGAAVDEALLARVHAAVALRRRMALAQQLAVHGYVGASGLADAASLCDGRCWHPMTVSTVVP